MSTVSETPVACTLGAADVKTQSERWRKLYAEAGNERSETDAGLRVSLRRSPAVERELRELAAVETSCCAWADWRVAGTAEELVLEISSAGHGVPVIHGWFLSDRPSPTGSSRYA